MLSRVYVRARVRACAHSCMQLIAAIQLRFLDIVPKGLAGYLQKGFFDLRSCIQV